MKRGSRFLVPAIITGLLFLSQGFAQHELSESDKAQFRKAVEDYVLKDVQLKRQFLIVHPVTGQPLSLEFDHLHNGIAAHPKGHLVCVDFKDRQGKVYDVDVVAADEGEGFEVTEILLHKVDGQTVTNK